MKASKINTAIFLISAIFALRLFIEGDGLVAITGQLISILLLLGLSLLTVKNFKIIAPRNSLLIIVPLSLSIILSIVNSIEYSIETINTISNALRYLIVLLTVAAAYRYRNYAYTIAQTFQYSVLGLTAILFIAGLVLIPPADYQGMLRHYFPFQNPNTLGATAYVSLIILLLYKTQNFIGSRTYITLFLIYAIMLLLSWSMTSIISAILFILISSFRFTPRRTLLLVVSFTFVVIFFKDAMYNRFVNSLVFNIDSLEFGEGSSVQWRIFAWSNYLSALNNGHWLFGFGAGVSRELLDQGYWHAKANFSAPGTHNDYIQILVDFGLIGLFAYIYLVIKLIYMSLKIRNPIKSRIYSGAFISMLLYTSFDNIMDTRLFFFFAFAFFPFYFIDLLEAKNHYKKSHQNAALPERYVGVSAFGQGLSVR